jgi:hypothetical protein
VVPTLFTLVLAVGLVRTGRPKAAQGGYSWVAPEFEVSLLSGAFSSGELESSWSVPAKRRAKAQSTADLDSVALGLMAGQSQDLNSPAGTRTWRATWSSTLSHGSTLRRGESTPSGQDLSKQGEPEAVVIAPLCDQSLVRIVQEEEPFSSVAEGWRPKQPLAWSTVGVDRHNR